MSKIPYKFTSLDYVFLSALGAVVLGFVILGFALNSRAAEWATKCRDVGGYPVQARDAWVCLKRDSVIEVQ